MTDLSLSTICNQRIRQMLFTVPPQRFTPISPYPQYTQSQLDMRRKAEVLSYSATKSNTKTNNYTKAEKYALFISGRNQTTSYPTLVQTVSSEHFIAGNLFYGTSDVSLVTFNRVIVKAKAKTCPKIDIPTPTSSSNVPGPIKYLYYDRTIPLYNYATNERSYSSEPVSETDMWRTLNKQNQLCLNGINATISSVGILNPIDKPSYNFTYTTPIGLSYSAIVSNVSNSGPIDITNITLSVSSATVQVYYSGQLVQYVSPICIFSNNNMIFDISYSPLGTDSTVVSISNYIGNLSIQNLHLFTSPGFIYDIQINCIMNIVNNASLIGKYTISNEKYGVICNFSGSNVFNNCTLKSSPVSTLTSFSFTPMNI
uniref:Uncharacterized protein n=1 Tax=viral metagenome TaxID=1070528 RepID=A0A6C0D3Z8_9ZZZZ